jgi:cell division protein FtsZ
MSGLMIMQRMAREVIPLGLGQGKARPRLKAVGIGGAGCNAIASCDFDAVALCNNRDSFVSRPHHRKVVLSEESVRFIRSISPGLLSAADSEAVRGMREALGESDMLFLFTGLGGETGSHLTPGMAHFARRCSNLVVVSAALPFSVEGAGRKETARKALPAVMEAAHATITYPNDGLLKLTPNLPLRQAFKVMDSIMMFPATELAQVITRDDLTALREDLTKVHELRLGVGEGGGLNREEQVVTDALTSPWFDQPLEKVALAIVVVIGREVDQYTMSGVLDRLLYRIPNARVRYGGRSDPNMGEGLRMMLLLGFAP